MSWDRGKWVEDAEVEVMEKTWITENKFKPADEDCDKEGMDIECQECPLSVECYEAQA